MIPEAVTAAQFLGDKGEDEFLFIDMVKVQVEFGNDNDESSAF